jgi:single-strand DNA-binding protein
MRDINKVILMGRLGQDPILRETKSGTRVVQLSVATTYRTRAMETSEMNSSNSQEDLDANVQSDSSADPEGTESSLNGVNSSREYSDSTQWHRIIVWGTLAEKCSQFLKKGAPLFVEGSIRSRPWVDDQKVKRTSFEVHATNISFLPSPKRSLNPTQSLLHEVS